MLIGKAINLLLAATATNAKPSSKLPRIESGMDTVLVVTLLSCYHSISVFVHRRLVCGEVHRA
jgi:hypothetical protein